ncbi:MAG: hypothetical protein ACI4TK_07885 [Agathobacter sp.]
MKPMHIIVTILLCILIVLQGIVIYQNTTLRRFQENEHTYIAKKEDRIISQIYGLEDQLEELQSLINQLMQRDGEIK